MNNFGIKHRRPVISSEQVSLVPFSGFGAKTGRPHMQIPTFGAFRHLVISLIYRICQTSRLIMSFLFCNPIIRLEVVQLCSGRVEINLIYTFLAPPAQLHNIKFISKRPDVR